MGLVNTISYEELYSLVDIEFNDSTYNIPAEARKSGIFKEVPMPDGTGKFRRFSEYDFEAYAHDKPEGGDAAIQKSQLGYSIDATLIRKGVNVEYTYEAKAYEKYSFNPDSVRAAKGQLVRRLDIDLQHRITFATATSYVNMDGNTVNIAVGDGLALASTAHTLLASPLTYRNILANNPQVSKGALEAMEKMWVENMLNNFGQKLQMAPNVIFSTDDPNSNNTIRELMKATAGVSAPNAGVPNVYEAKYERVVLSLIATDANGSPDSTKAKYWGLIRKGGVDCWQAKLAVNEEAHLMPLMDSNSVDVRSDNVSIPARIGYAIAILSGRLFAISKGDGTA